MQHPQDQQQQGYYNQGAGAFPQGPGFYQQAPVMTHTQNPVNVVAYPQGPVIYHQRPALLAYHSRASKSVGGLQITVGILAMIGAGVSIAAESYSYYYSYYTGFWCGPIVSHCESNFQNMRRSIQMQLKIVCRTSD